MAQAKKALEKSSRSAQTAKRIKSYHNFIGGRWIPSSSDEWLENRNPADTRDVVGRFPRSTEEDVDEAVAAAAKAFDGWRHTPAPRRAEILFRVGEILIRDKQKYTADMTREMGSIALTMQRVKAVACTDSPRPPRCRTSSRCACGNPSVCAA